MNKYSYCYLSGNIKNIKNPSLAQRLIAVISIKTSLGQRTRVRPVWHSKAVLPNPRLKKKKKK